MPGKRHGIPLTKQLKSDARQTARVTSDARQTARVTSDARQTARVTRGPTDMLMHTTDMLMHTKGIEPLLIQASSHFANI